MRHVLTAPRFRAALLRLVLPGLVWSLYALAAVRLDWLAGTPPRVAPPRADAAIVLGAAAWGEQPSPALAERLAPAAALYQQGRIPRDALALDEASTSTASNLGNALAIMEERGWQTAVVITHGYHLHRAMLVAHDLGLSAAPYGMDSQVLVLPPLVVREVAALAAHWAWEHWLLLGYPPVMVVLGDAVVATAVLLLLLAPMRRRRHPLHPGSRRTVPLGPGTASDKEGR